MVCSGGLTLSGGNVGEYKIGPQACLCTAELGVMCGEGPCEHGDGFWASEAGEGMSAPAGEVEDWVEGEVGPAWDRLRVFREDAIRVGEGMQAGILLAVRGERLALRSGEPRT
jgi:hypothetical protein